MNLTAIDQYRDLLQGSEIKRSREDFIGRIVRELSIALENVVGPAETKSFVTVVGTMIGEDWNREYREAFGNEGLSLEQIAAALVDLKARIGGNFSIVSIDEQRIVLKNTRCPFGALIEGCPAMCQMTSSVFGRIVADNLGYARVTVDEAISQGHPGCLVVIDLCDTGAAPDSCDEYFKI